MRLKRSDALVFTPSDGGFAAYNFLSKSAFECGPDLLDLLSRLGEWTDEAALGGLLPDFDPAERDAVMDGLAAVGAVIGEDTQEARREAEYVATWSWGLPSAMMHFSVQMG